MNHPRSMPRFKRRMRIRYRDDGDDKEMIALTRDVSPSGIGVNANRPATLGALLQLSLEVSDEESIPLTGRVVWVRRVPAGRLAVEKGGFGVQLTSADERWYSYLAALAA
jgi:hypothetical protein